MRLPSKLVVITNFVKRDKFPFIHSNISRIESIENIVIKLEFRQKKLLALQPYAMYIVYRIQKLNWQKFVNN